MHVTEERPGEYLHLEDIRGRAGLHPAFYIVVGLLGAIPVVGACIGIQGEVSNTLITITFGAVVMIFCLAQQPLMEILHSQERQPHYPRALTIDQQHGVWTVEDSTSLSAGTGAKIPLSRLREVRVGTRTLEEASRGEPLLLEVEIFPTNGIHRAWKFPVEGLRTRDDVLDLCHRLGAAAGLPAFHIEWDSPLGLRVWLRDPRPEHAGVPHQPVARPAQPAAWIASPPKAAAPPEAQAMRFDPEASLGLVVFHVKDWRPGQHVRFEWEGFPWGRYLAGYAISLALCLGFAVYEMKGGGVTLAGGLWLAILGSPSMVGAASLIYRKGRTVSEVTDFLWPTQTLSLGVGGRRQVPFSDLKWIETRGIHRVQSREGGANHLCHVETWVHTADRSFQVAATLDCFADIERPMRALLPLGVELARSLGIPHQNRGEEFQGDWLGHGM